MHYPSLILNSSYSLQLPAHTVNMTDLVEISLGKQDRSKKRNTRLSQLIANY